MTQSMTAFARTERRNVQGEWVWEIRSVNHRFLETSVRLPDELRMLESAVRGLVGARLGRGKVDCNLRYRPEQAARPEIQLNLELARGVAEAAGRISGLTDGGEGLTALQILQWPGVVEQERPDMAPVGEAALDLLHTALDELTENRRREGAKLAALILSRCVTMRELLAQARNLVPGMLEAVKARLRHRLGDLMDALETGRLEQELLLLTQRLDVDEEIDRLQTHLDEIAAVMKRNEPVGRRLDFLMQELNREANTLTSKSSDVRLTQCAVEMKVLIEQMREQIQNIE
ncbi:MAG: YicC family protein [Gammaproteobacteria bacterium]|nr:YicC family protein [Gammaproteobacteria bacterium]MBU1653660.1 YicC family protein [Gammaproteobacteria bacterium]MBU1962490.1 YicC family protein [Gammaproteobacteria bacterium]